MRVTVCACAPVSGASAAENAIRMETETEMGREKGREEQTMARHIYGTAATVPLNRSTVVSSGTSSVSASPSRAKYRSFLQLSVLSDTHSSHRLHHISCGDGPSSGSARWWMTQCRRTPKAIAAGRRRNGIVRRSLILWASSVLLGVGFQLLCFLLSRGG